MQMSRRAFSAGVVAFPALLATAAAAGPAEAGALTRALEEERRRRGLPALAGLVMRHGRVLESAAVGVRARGADVTVAGSDRWHIGSCAKAMTATLIARYVERGALDWNATVGDLLPELSSGMDRAAARITLHQLLTMTAGLPANPTSTPNEGGLANGLRLMISGNDHLIGQLRALEGLADNDVERRKQIAARMLASPPRWEPGSRFGYSNTAYVIVGAIAEAAGRAPYEDLLAEEVFRPLGVESFGFGAPGRSDILDQPRGHVARRDGAPVPPDSVAAELPSFLRPAGGVHIGLGDWSRFVADHVSGEAGDGALLSKETYVRLHTPAPGVDQPYACGWGAPMRRGRRALTHLGNNTLWTAGVSAYPETGYVILHATNDGRASSALGAFEGVEERLRTRYPDL